ncbi:MULTISPECIES: 3-hydroxyacyl-CoA dehydrogenase family protein [Cryobacterium]|uniref:3-hydroxyacyl-CoA dehydrogenase family protein n=1 Tax=Cryobacterium lyxosi TaxID=1259228 RepID=A0A4R8ZGY7_9MICO|nr:MULTISPECIES: 3-hydroxyacyl-CoA dehydrogenase family protein [Cryobacterium]TFD27716.1 3-hydroxyacyl-CoA dehydrogenase family protein [Cryobacterium lyxosi]
MTVTANISTTAVVGSGYMGGGIAQVLALGGHPVRLADIDRETAERARIRLIRQAEDFEARGLMPVGAADTIGKNLSAADSIEDAVVGADYIAEAAPETLRVKLDILQRISQSARIDAIIGTNTSAIPIGELAAAVVNPERFLGVHWMNPAPFIPGVELIPGPNTAPEAIDVAEALIVKSGKIPARVADTPGFVANRLQFALYKEAMRIVEEGTATPAQIDAVVSNSFGFRLALFGPFAIGDMAGLDVYEAAYRTLETAYGDRFSPPESLTRIIKNGDLGLKSGRGILDIDAAETEALLAYRDHAYARLSQLRVELGKAPGL